MPGRRKVGASYFWARDSRYMKEGRRNISRNTHQNFTPLIGTLSVTAAAPGRDGRNAEGRTDRSHFCGQWALRRKTSS